MVRMSSRRGRRLRKAPPASPSGFIAALTGVASGEVFPAGGGGRAFIRTV